MDESVWGIDIGGANIKLCHCDGHSVSIPFPMWTDYRQLGSAVADLMLQISQTSEAAGTQRHWTTESVMAVTMTGELADCFFSRREGVSAILDGLTGTIAASQCRVYAVGGRWLTVQQAKEAAWDVAASNWHALAEWLLSRPQLASHRCQAIVDIGSTTVDIIPVRESCIATAARTDRQRMQLGQLVYTGMERTPVHAVVNQLVVHGEFCPVMAERFATVLDAHLILRTVNEQLDNCDTADGRPRSRAAALARLARMVGEDSETLSESEIEQLADQVLETQSQQVAESLSRNLPAPLETNSSEVTRDGIGHCELAHGQRLAQDQPTNVLVSGHGRPLVARLQKRDEFSNLQFIMLDELVGWEASRCAPALAVAQLWRERTKLDASKANA